MTPVCVCVCLRVHVVPALCSSGSSRSVFSELRCFAIQESKSSVDEFQVEGCTRSYTACMCVCVYIIHVCPL